MKLVEETHPILRQKCDPFDFEEPIMDPYELSAELQKVRREGAGVGLAAPQVGLNTQVLVIGMGDFKTEGTEDYDQVFFNPIITEYSEEKIYMLEGCLSYPRLFVKIKRPQNVIITWDNEEGNSCTENFGGMTSRILQHEIDHLSGILFMQRAARYHLEKAKKELKIYNRRKKIQNNA
jgi:peptide deformylase